MNFKKLIKMLYKGKIYNISRTFRVMSLHIHVSVYVMYKVVSKGFMNTN